MKKIQLFSVSALVLFLTGCGGALKKWKEETFNQAHSYHSAEKEMIVRSYLRSLSLYDQFETVALFDALWVSDEVKTLLSDIHVQLLGKSREVRNNFLRRQLKDNSEYVTFYVLTQHHIALGDAAAPWHLHLATDGNSYSPISVKLTELSPEYKVVLGKKITPHKDIYEVKFLRKNSKGKDILEEGKDIQLFFNGLHHYGVIKWNLSLHKNFISPLDIHAD